ncbi:MAG TPA: hypothetical protein VFZ13_00090 [Gemmatimonadales bacterium]
MPGLVRNALAVVAGFLVGSLVNMALISLSPSLIPPPAGVDVRNAESLGSSIHLFEAKHFVMPFLAHALGTFAGALTAFLIAVTYKSRVAWIIGFLFLLGGIAAIFVIPAPVWFIALDLLVAYLPMAWLAIRTGARLQRDQAEARASVA